MKNFQRDEILRKAKELVNSNAMQRSEYKSLNVVLSSGRLSPPMLTSMLSRLGIK